MVPNSKIILVNGFESVPPHLSGNWVSQISSYAGLNKKWYGQNLLTYRGSVAPGTRQKMILKEL